MDPREYKTFHENHMKHNTGTSMIECTGLVSSATLLVGITSWMTPRLPKSVVPVVEYFFIILPVTLEATILSDVNHLIYINLFLSLVIIAIFKLDLKAVCNKLNSRFEGRSSITSYRSITNLYSALCILAVDFTVFPKRLAKTESFGFGFMDLGVGFYVISNALVEKHTPTKNEIVKLLKSVSVLLVLGGIRLVSVKSLDYHEHISEYGVHWNFFFTLASCRLISYLIKTVTNYANPIWLALATGLTHQMLLAGGLQEWVFSNVPRDSLLSANREGLTSSLGYVSLYFAGSSLGKLIHNSGNLPCKKIFQILVMLIMINYGVLIILLKTIGVSRRLVNLGYIIWILLLTMVQLALIIVKELLILGVSNGKKQAKSSPPLTVLMECINSNALFFFLFANLLTGLVNTLFQTLLLGETLSMVIISSYMAVLYTVNYFLYINNIRLKL